MFCDTKGIRLAYDEQGTGLPLVFLHAFPLNRSMWTPQTTALSRQFRTIAVDLAGMVSRMPRCGHFHSKTTPMMSAHCLTTWLFHGLCWWDSRWAAMSALRSPENTGAA